jgi:hypothetical protein
MNNLVLDLFSGTGSATQPFVECEKHWVVRIDNRVWKHSHPDVRADVKYLPIDSESVEFLWASPPCSEFSSLKNLRRAHHGLAQDPEKGMVTVRASVEAIRRLKPKKWVLENVKGAIPHISKVLGKPRLGWCGRWLWMNFDLEGLMPSMRFIKPVRGSENLISSASHYKRMGFGLSYRELSAARGMIPRPLSEAVHRAVCSNTITQV